MQRKSVLYLHKTHTLCDVRANERSAVLGFTQQLRPGLQLQRTAVMKSRIQEELRLTFMNYFLHERTMASIIGYM